MIAEYCQVPNFQIFIKADIYPLSMNNKKEKYPFFAEFNIFTILAPSEQIILIKRI